MFRGTKTQTQEEMSRILTKAGARENAYTTDDFTNYYITFAKEDLESMLALQADRFQNLQYGEATSRRRLALFLANTTTTTPTRPPSCSRRFGRLHSRNKPNGLPRRA